MAREGMGAGMALVLTRWRLWLAFAAFGSALAFAYRGDWVWCAGAAALVCDTSAARVLAGLGVKR